MGRPRLIDQPCPGIADPETGHPTYSEAILDYIRLGAPLHLAAKAVGINDGTLRSWRAQGAKTRPDARYAAFLADCEKAEAESTIRALADIRRAAQGDVFRTTKTVTKTVRNAAGDLVPVVETTVTEGVTRAWTAAAWLCERRATPDFGRHRTWRDPNTPDPKAPTDPADRIVESVEQFLESLAGQPEVEQIPGHQAEANQEGTT